mgnify:FL=1
MLMPKRFVNHFSEGNEKFFALVLRPSRDAPAQFPSGAGPLAAGPA